MHYTCTVVECQSLADELFVLTACTPGSAPGPTLGNEYGITLPFLYMGCGDVTISTIRRHVLGIGSIFICFVTKHACDGRMDRKTELRSKRPRYYGLSRFMVMCVFCKDKNNVDVTAAERLQRVVMCLMHSIDMIMIVRST